MRSDWIGVLKARLIGAGLACALMGLMGANGPSMAQERLGAGFRAHQSVRRRCLASLLGRATRHRTHEECMQNKMGQLPKVCLDKLLDAMAGSSFKVCKNQTYALCAAARCNVYDGVAYCQCDEKHGDSISLPFPMGKGQDVCSVNAAGADNKFMVSTYSLPESDRLAAGRRRGLHLPGRKVRRRLRPMRRGTLLPKHRGDDVPGLRQARAEGQIICSCPITDVQLRRRPRLSDPGAVPVRQVVLQILQERCRQQQHGFDDLCRRPDRHGRSPDRPAHRQSGSAVQRMRVRVSPALRSQVTDRDAGVTVAAPRVRLALDGPTQAQAIRRGGFFDPSGHGIANDLYCATETPAVGASRGQLAPGGQAIRAARGECPRRSRGTAPRPGYSERAWCQRNDLSAA